MRLVNRSVTISSPIGSLLLVAEGERLLEIRFLTVERAQAPDPAGVEGDTAVLREARSQLGAYFAGELRDFDLPLAPRGTPFQLAVWEALLDIPYGETWSYADLARRLDRPTATRAVGAANGRNPLPIVVPCHRVIGADGSLTGYGGGLPIKRKLLRLEGALDAPTLFDLG
jgi:methylated-DNA-[protein]-cysteine S-methyltransferase